jgi:hypothetical protein
MADLKRLKFLVSRGMGGMYFAAGTEADIPEPWATHFIKNGSAELVNDEPAEIEKPIKAKAKQSATKKKK